MNLENFINLKGQEHPLASRLMFDNEGFAKTFNHAFDRSDKSKVDLPNLTLVDDRSNLRAQVVDQTAASLAESRSIRPKSQSGAMLVDAITYSFRTGGARSADSLAQEISEKLPDGMKLKISEDAALDRRFGAELEKQGKQKPDYIRKIELFDKDGHRLDHLEMALAKRRERA